MEDCYKVIRKFNGMLNVSAVIVHFRCQSILSIKLKVNCEGASEEQEEL